MRNKFKNNISEKGVLTGLVLITLLFGFLCALFGEITFPLYAASLAALFLFDNKSKRILSVSIPILVIAINLLLGSYVPGAVVFAVPSAFVLYYMFNKGKSKGECAGYMTAICTVMITVGVFAFAMLAVREFSFTAAIEYFEGVYSRLYDEILKNFENTVSLNPALEGAGAFSEEMIATLFNSLVLTIPSIAVCLAFLLVGITFKIFGFIVSRISDRPEVVVNWRFSTDNIFAYFYVAVFIFSGLIGAADVFGIALANVQNVFMVVYSYIGLNFAHFIISRRKSSLFATLLLIFAVVMASSLAISILSFLGVYFTVIKNKSSDALSGN